MEIILSYAADRSIMVSKNSDRDPVKGYLETDPIYLHKKNIHPLPLAHKQFFAQPGQGSYKKIVR